MKTIDISVVGFEHEEVEHFKNDYVRRLYVFPTLQLAHNHFNKNEHAVNVIIVRYNKYFNLTTSFLKLVRSKPENNRTAIIMLDDDANGVSLRWFFNKKLVDDIFEFNFNISEAMPRIQSLIYLRKSESSDTVLESFNVKIPTAKRVFDIVVASSVLLLLSPLLVIVSIGVLMDSGYPFFYKSQRVGTGYKVFDFYKFRSMKKNADKELKDLKGQNQYANKGNKVAKECINCKVLGKPCSPLVYSDGESICEAQHFQRMQEKKKGTFIKIANDPRVTRFGKFIRNTSIDELPQLINVLKGDMSIVGNRPLPLYEAELLTTDTWSERFNAPAGITGLWQVEKRGSKSMSEFERKELDNKYARNYTVWSDIKLLLRTIPALLQKESV